MKVKNIAILVSGGGTNLQAIIDAHKAGKITNGRLALVLSSNEKAYALQRAADNGIESCVIKKGSNRDEFSDAILAKLEEKDIDIIVLAGFMHILSGKIIEKYKNKILNVHPALIPSFCGEGFYGLHVHEAALSKGVKVTGATVHFVNEIADGGPIILQKAVYIEENDTPETLQRRVMENAEWEILPRALDLLCNEKLSVENSTVKIKE
ncbi:MAG: phosphoribosylglycinamide formyltransferase [Clostridia bacterium]|nr:phosphoribosylglycinamide formyltransferase [Oscillospiraceae bacterium]MBQ6701798.1 phosphoribosylglycinamide formyltransferase [Clostridia bacterium]